MNAFAAMPFSSWSVERKAAAAIFGLLGMAVLASAALYLSGVLFLLVNKANPGQAQFASIVSYWDRYSDDPGLRRKLLGSIAAISLLVGGIGVMNIMLVSITERTREIGIRMATGARAANVRLQFLTEAVVVCIVGGLIGVAGGLVQAGERVQRVGA